ncbi:hypothetical protein ACFPYI_02420 [Halomarina salina]|uniref:DUF7322 domain-containing protein n=1 Tax=Halomarina salina TaxID=1872699 RepID=A0ABD5RHZ1_9EURY|nr:hypothetical protein [Halomarina salina]
MLEDDDDPWPDEPEEFDPDSLAPSVEVPEAPTAPEFSDSNVDEDVAQAFWATVVMANVALFGISVGAMIVYFLGDLQTGGMAILVGVVAALFGYRYYAGFQRDRQS